MGADPGNVEKLEVPAPAEVVLVCCVTTVRPVVVGLLDWGEDMVRVRKDGKKLLIMEKQRW